MKKTILALMASLVLVQPAFATESEVATADQTSTEVVFDLEEGAMSESELQQYTAPAMTTFGRRDRAAGAVVGGVIGGIIGAIAADRYDDQYGGGRHGGRWDDGRHGGHHGGRWDDGRHDGGRWDDGYGRPQVMCFAQNRRGEVFRAIGMRPRMVQERAMMECENFSRRCRPMGCRPAHR